MVWRGEDLPSTNCFLKVSACWAKTAKMRGKVGGAFPRPEGAILQMGKRSTPPHYPERHAHQPDDSSSAGGGGFGAERDHGDHDSPGIDEKEMAESPAPLGKARSRKSAAVVKTGIDQVAQRTDPGASSPSSVDGRLPGLNPGSCSAS